MSFNLVNEIAGYVVLSASGQVAGPGGGLVGFLAATAGTVAVTTGTTAGGANIVLTTAVAAGQWLPMPFATPTGAYATLAGGATGTFGAI